MSGPGSGRSGILIAWFGLLTGCVGAGHSRYLTARPLPSKRANATLGVHGVGALGAGIERKAPKISLGYPDFHGRMGLARDVDLGIKVGAGFIFVWTDAPPSVGGDIKWRFVKSRFLALSVDPMVQYTRVRPTATDENGYLHRGDYNSWLFDVPFVLGLSPASWATFVLSPGMSYGAERTDLRPLSRVLDAIRVTGAAARCGFGVELWTSERAALHPEFTVVVPFDDKGRRVVYTAGFGLRFGYGLPTE